MRWHLLVKRAVLCSLALGASARAAEFPGHLLSSLEGAEQFELLSINPDRRAAKSSDDFHGWAVLGRTKIVDLNARKTLVTAFKEGVEGNKERVAGCFNPRHGIRVTRGSKTVDFVICFECLHARVYVEGNSEKDLLTTGSPEPAFDQVLKSANIPLARDLAKR